MTFKFKSQATGDLVMVQAHADALLRLIGKSATSSGVLVPEDMAAALLVFKSLSDDAQRGSPENKQEGAADDKASPPEDSFADEAVSLRKRAWPLIQMIEKAHAAGKPIVWGV